MIKYKWCSRKYVCVCVGARACVCGREKGKNARERASAISRWEPGERGEGGEGGGGGVGLSQEKQACVCARRAREGGRGLRGDSEGVQVWTPCSKLVRDGTGAGRLMDVWRAEPTRGNLIDETVLFWRRRPSRDD